MPRSILSTLFRRMSTGSSTGIQPNRLTNETSPYLQQHKYNPVDWYPWRQEAFKAAKESNKPILLSIGYSTCHWCHVMERESFENKDIAAIMNQGFVNIKVDREERPDVDRHYMAFVQGFTGGGGWPLTVFLAPDLTPFFGGTYFPPTDSGHQLGFPSLLRLIQEKWTNNEEELKQSGAEVMKIIESASAARSRPTGNKLVTESQLKAAATEAFKHLEHTYDRTYGGFGGAPKFPTPPTLAFLLRSAFQEDPKTCSTASEMVVGTLEKMAKGGIHDHIEGGFHRYSVDRQWHLPHFEKMLYDQGQLMSIYSSAYALRPLPIFKAAVHGIFEYIAKRLQSEGGAFFCAEDADSLPSVEAKEKKEGAFALWSQAELEECLSKELLEPFIKNYSVCVEGNIDSSKDPHGEMTGLNVLDTLNTSHGDSMHHQRPHLEIEELLNEGRHLVAARRATRPRPSLDDKILTAWNGLMISGLVRAYHVFGLNNRYIIAAQKATNFILDKMYDEHVGLHRIYKPSGHTPIAGFADDYAYFIQALLDLYESTLDQKYLDMAGKLQARMTAAFWVSEAGVFVSSKNPELPMQHIVDDYDGAEPSPSSVSALNLGRLYLLTEKYEYAEQQEKLFEAFSKRLVDLPFSMPSLLDAFLFMRLPPTMAVIEAASLEDAVELKQTVLSTYNPGLILKGIIDPSIKRASAHVCKGKTCSSPVYDAASFASLLK